MLNKEPIGGSLWFLCVMIEAMTVICMLQYTIKRLNLDKCLMPTSILFMVCVSYLLTHYGITIPRVSNIPIALLCIQIGILCKHYNIDFSNSYLFVCALLLIVVGVFSNIRISFNSNLIGDPAYFIFITICSAYALFYLCLKFEKIKIFSYILSNIGKASLYIMAFHLLSFKLPMYFINRANLFKLRASADSILELLFILTVGIVLPMIIYRIRNLLCLIVWKQ